MDDNFISFLERITYLFQEIIFIKNQNLTSRRPSNPNKNLQQIWKLEKEEYPEGASITYGYDYEERKITERTKGGRRQEYTYDAWGNIVAVKNGERNQTTFTLDDWGRITKVTTPTGIEELYEYDYAGNVIKAVNGEGKSIQYNYNSINMLESIIYQDGKKESYQYDKEGNL